MSLVPIVQAIISGSSLREFTGLFREAGAFASAMNTCLIISLSLVIITSKRLYFYVAVFFTFGILMTILKKTIISSLIVWLLFFLYQFGSKIKFKMFFYGLIFLVFAYLSYGDAIRTNVTENQDYIENVGADGHVRLGMYIAATNIATDFFPFGSGMGTFGSLASITDGYSDIYYTYGVDKIGSNSPEDVARGQYTLLDTYWPHILGELGFLGTLFFFLLWFYPIFLSKKILKYSKNPFEKGIAFYILLMALTISWEGFTLYTPELPIFVMLNFGFGGMCYYHLKNIIYKSKKMN